MQASPESKKPIHDESSTPAAGHDDPSRLYLESYSKLSAAQCAVLTGEHIKAAELLDEAAHLLDKGKRRAASGGLGAAMQEYETVLARSIQGARRYVDARTDATQRTQVEVGPDCRWVRTSEGHTLELGRQPTRRALLQQLFERHTQEPGLGVSTIELSSRIFANVPQKLAADRIYAAICSLRRDGLKNVLFRAHDGYRIRAGTNVLRHSSKPW